MRFLAFGDVHLGGRRSHERNPGDGLQDQADNLAAIGDLAIQHGVDAVMNAGDTFEGPTLSPAEVVVYANFVARMRDNGIPVFTLLGNGRHDLAMRDESALSVFDHVPGVETFTRPDVRVIGETALCLLPWTHPGRLVADQGGGDRDEIHATAAELLLRAAEDLRDTHDARHKVLVLHGSIEGAGLPNGLPIDTHTSDILPVYDLLDLDFDAVIASHIHVPQAWGPDGWTRSIYPEAPSPFFYTGSPLPLNFGEAGYEHGVWLLDLAETVEVRFVPVEGGRRFVTVDVDLTGDGPGALGLDETDAVAAAVATRLPLGGDIVRVRIRGTEQQTGRVDVAALKVLLADTHKSYLLFDTVRVQRARVEEIDEEISPLAAVDLYVQAVGMGDQDAEALRVLTAGYLDRLGVAS